MGATFQDAEVINDTDVDDSDDDEDEHDEELESITSKKMFFADMVRDYNVDPDGRYPGFWSDPFCLADFRCPVLKVYAPRLAVSFCIFLFGLYVNNVSQAWLQKHIAGYYEQGWAPVPPQTASVKLWDITYENLPYISSTKPADTFAFAAPAMMIARFVIMPGPMSLRWTILCRWQITWGILWFCRAFTILTTPLPNPDHTCVPRISFPDNIFLEAWANLPIVPWYDELTCQDVLYSGHTVALTLNMLFIFKYVRLAPYGDWSASNAMCSLSTVVNTLGILMVIVGYYFIVASHFHYTVDVLVGAMMTLLVFNFYHYLSRVSMLRARRSRSCLHPFFRWLEWHAKDIRNWRNKVEKVLQEMHNQDQDDTHNAIAEAHDIHA
eukprot:TRINITY_DN5330_c0_g1_i2.p1 TRINITY_DN5330_c0_g1~~TRINITY_DN5330_c0_g1_i2.p1  ORF type:complete len:381 (+),score=33.39 TRINITY_DN5330_c0_g1_i2:42-1184(+)